MRLRTGPVGPTPPRIVALPPRVRRRIGPVYLPLRWQDRHGPCTHPEVRLLRPAEVRYAARHGMPAATRCTTCGRLL